VNNPTPPGMPVRNGGGHGIVGMRERAQLLRGTLEAGGSNGTYRVHARLPYGEEGA
jgi:signal transduction histidine kinase